MKTLTTYDKDRKHTPNFDAVIAALKKRGIMPNFAIENNVVNMRNIGDYNVSGGGAIFLVPDDFKAEGYEH